MQPQTTASSPTAAFTDDLPDGRAVEAADLGELPAIPVEHAGESGFVDRLEPTDVDREDVDTARLVVRIQAGDQGLRPGARPGFAQRLSGG